MELFLTNVEIKYTCSKCNTPVKVYWFDSRFPIARMGMAFSKKCSNYGCNKSSMHVTSISGKVERRAELGGLS